MITFRTLSVMVPTVSYSKSFRGKASKGGDIFSVPLGIREKNVDLQLGFGSIQGRHHLGIGFYESKVG